MGQKQLGLGTVPALDIRQQCTGFIYGLQISDALIRSGQAKTVLSDEGIAELTQSRRKHKKITQEIREHLCNGRSRLMRQNQVQDRVHADFTNCR